MALGGALSLHRRVLLWKLQLHLRYAFCPCNYYCFHGRENVLIGGYHFNAYSIEVNNYIRKKDNYEKGVYQRRY